MFLYLGLHHQDRKLLLSTLIIIVIIKTSNESFVGFSVLYLQAHISTLSPLFDCENGSLRYLVKETTYIRFN